jgi:hypothetical protein
MAGALFRNVESTPTPKWVTRDRTGCHHDFADRASFVVISIRLIESSSFGAVSAENSRTVYETAAAQLYRDYEANEVARIGASPSRAANRISCALHCSWWLIDLLSQFGARKAAASRHKAYGEQIAHTCDVASGARCTSIVGNVRPCHPRSSGIRSCRNWHMLLGGA